MLLEIGISLPLSTVWNQCWDSSVLFLNCCQVDQGSIGGCMFCGQQWYWGRNSSTACRLMRGVLLAIVCWFWLFWFKCWKIGWFEHELWSFCCQALYWISKLDAIWSFCWVRDAVTEPFSVCSATFAGRCLQWHFRMGCTSKDLNAGYFGRY